MHVLGVCSLKRYILFLFPFFFWPNIIVSFVAEVSFVLHIFLGLFIGVLTICSSVRN